MNTFQEPVNDTLQSSPSQIQFRWHRDRFAHHLSLCKAHRRLPLLASWEGDPDQQWATSPALQELHFENQTAGAVAMLQPTNHFVRPKAIGVREVVVTMEDQCRFRSFEEAEDIAWRLCIQHKVNDEQQNTVSWQYKIRFPTRIMAEAYTA